jgi:hypothetical protein
MQEAVIVKFSEINNCMVVPTIPLDQWMVPLQVADNPIPKPVAVLIFSVVWAEYTCPVYQFVICRGAVGLTFVVVIILLLGTLRHPLILQTALNEPELLTIMLFEISPEDQIVKPEQFDEDRVMDDPSQKLILPELEIIGASGVFPNVIDIELLDPLSQPEAD